MLSGRVDGLVEPTVSDDAGGGYVPPALIAGHDLAIQKVQKNGISCLLIKNLVYFAALWWEVEYFAERGIVPLAFVNSYSFVAHQPGGRGKLYGTNPMAFGFPRAVAAATVVGATIDAASTTTTGVSSLLSENNNYNRILPIYGQPLIWDQASAAMALGEIQLCHRDGYPLPKGVAIDTNGAPTTDPAAALVRQQGDI